jgi:uncharacterized heparinase superfamily protein
MGLPRLLRLWRTARHLRPEQVAYRLYYRLAKPLVRRRVLAPVDCAVRRPWRKAWLAPLIGPCSHPDQGQFEFLGERGDLAAMQGWNSPAKTKLWLYNLHYLDDLNAVDADARAARHAWLIDRWVDDNPGLVGNGWEPYPLSLRIVNLVKWFARQPEIPSRWIDSLALQAQALAAQEERHILANHLFANGKALAFAGAFFAGAHGRRWLDRGLKILDREVDEQFLADGGHFELSPMYHATLLWDLCDLVNLARRSGVAELAEREPIWRSAMEKGIAWLECMCHPDGEIAFFNDAAFGIAPRIEQIASYAASLGCRAETHHPEPLGCRHLANTGYVAVDLGEGGKAIFDVAQVGPGYQPGHAHADTLSFELSLFGHRVLVNSGTSRYGEDAERLRQRSTAAHNTVEIDGQDSSEVWAGFRVGRRARPGRPAFRRVWGESGGALLVACSHDGYRHLPGGPVHRRQWECSPNRLRIMDSVSGRFRRVVSRFHLHPDVLPGHGQELHLPGGQRVRWSVSGGTASVVPSSWHPEFGFSRASHCIEVSLDGPESTVDFSWG